MKRSNRYRILIENEGRLETVASFTKSLSGWLWIVSSIFAAVVVAGVAIVYLTPIHRWFPGYLKENERAATEMQILRLDSLREAYETNALFLENLRNVIAPSPQQRNAPAKDRMSSNHFSADSLMPTTPEEARFVSLIKEKEKYNVSVAAPLAAESMMFMPLSPESVVSAASTAKEKAEIILARNSVVGSIGEGTVISVTQSLRDGGAVIIIQHPKGFLSRIGRLGQVIVETGESVGAGQPIALPNRGNARKGELVTLEMWHNGTKLVPYQYIEDYHNDQTPLPVIDEEVGRGRF